jgi:hypothetical protein
MENSTDKVAARLARMERRAGYAERELRHFGLWEKQMASRYVFTINMQMADQRHERLMRESV